MKAEKESQFSVFGTFLRTSRGKYSFSRSSLKIKLCNFLTLGSCSKLNNHLGGGGSSKSITIDYNLYRAGEGEEVLKCYNEERWFVSNIGNCRESL